MDKKKKIIIIIVIVLAIILLSVGGYFIYKNVTQGDGGNTKEDGNDGNTNTGTDTGNSSSSSGSSSSSVPSNPFSSSADLKKFQQYVINTVGNKTILGSGGDSGYGDDGKWGRKSALAYDKYGADYQTYLKAPLPLKVGDKVVIKNNTKGYTTVTRATPFNKGGVGSGWLSKGTIAGSIVEISTKWDSARISSLQYPMVSNQDEKVFYYYLKLSDLEKL